MDKHTAKWTWKGFFKQVNATLILQSGRVVRPVAGTGARPRLNRSSTLFFVQDPTNKELKTSETVTFTRCNSQTL